jgi:hypothetical protein
MSMDAATVLRAVEIGAPLAGKLIEAIAAGLAAGKTDEEATREALARLAAMPDLVPIGPEIEAILADARSQKP